MPMLVQYKIVDGFNEYYDYVIHQDDVDETDDENLINALIGEDRDEGDYRDIEVVYTKSKQYDEENCLTVKERSE